MNKKKGRILRGAVAGMTLAAVFLCGCALPFGAKEAEESEPEDNSISVEVQSPEVKTITNRANFSATVVAESEVKVIPLVGGEVLEKKCPSCGAPIHAGAVCSICGDSYISS